MDTGMQEEVPLSPRESTSLTSEEELRSHSTCFGSVSCYLQYLPSRAVTRLKSLKPFKICNIRVRLLSRVFHAPGTEPIRQLPVLPKESWYSGRSWCGLQWSGDFFAVFSKKTSQRFQDLLNNFDVQLDALVNFEEVCNRTEPLQQNQVATVVVEVNIYGNRDHAMPIGKFLSSLGLYLQQPFLLRDGVRYYNPHVYSMEGNEQTPVFEIGSDVGIRAGQQQHADALHVSTNQGPDDNAEDFSSILDSLSRGTMLGKRGGDNGICTTLKEYASSSVLALALHWILTFATVTRCKLSISCSAARLIIIYPGSLRYGSHSR